MLRDLGSNLYRMGNGRLITGTAWRETIAEKFSLGETQCNPDMELETLSDDLQDVKRRRHKVESSSYLDRATKDSASGRLVSDRRGIQHSENEGDIWN